MVIVPEKQSPLCHLFKEKRRKTSDTNAEYMNNCIKLMRYCIGS
jgi:hypothetical protein